MWVLCSKFCNATITNFVFLAPKNSHVHRLRHVLILGLSCWFMRFGILLDIHHSFMISSIVLGASYVGIVSCVSCPTCLYQCLLYDECPEAHEFSRVMFWLQCAMSKRRCSPFMTNLVSQLYMPMFMYTHPYSQNAKVAQSMSQCHTWSIMYNMFDSERSTHTSLSIISD